MIWIYNIICRGRFYFWGYSLFY